MKKQALISIKSFSQLEKEDAIEVLTPGDFYIEEECYKAQYIETEISGMDGTTTTLIIKKDSFILEREGSTNTKMEFQKGETSIALYATPYGMMDLQIHTKYLEMDIDENGGDIVAKYSMVLSGQPPIETKIMINIKIKE